MKLRVKEICKNQKLSISELANRLEVTRETLSRQIAENGNPTIETLEKIAKALNVPIYDLITDTKQIIGAVRIGDQLHTINSIEDLERLLEELKGS